MDSLLKDAIADAKTVRETALENAKLALTEAFTPTLQSMLSQKLREEDDEMDMDMDDKEDDEKEEEAPAMDAEAKMMVMNLVTKPMKTMKKVMKVNGEDEEDERDARRR